jgi:hypothetical protein
MDWEAFGAVAEACGAIAVIVTLVYLSIQIRQSNKLMKTTLAESHLNATNEISKILASDAAAADVFWEGIETGRDGLSTSQRRQFDALLYLFVNSGYQAFRQEDAESLLRTHWIFQYVGFRNWWEQYSQTYSADFKIYVDTQLAGFE